MIIAHLSIAFPHQGKHSHIHIQHPWPLIMWVSPAAHFLPLSLFFIPQIICMFYGPLLQNSSSLCICHCHSHFKHGAPGGTFFNLERLRWSLFQCREAGGGDSDTTTPLLSTHFLPHSCWPLSSYHFPLHWHWVSLQQQLLFLS